MIRRVLGRRTLGRCGGRLLPIRAGHEDIRAAELAWHVFLAREIVLRIARH